MTYTIPPKPAEPKQRLVIVTDGEEIDSIERAGLGDIIGACINGVWYAEAHSLAQFRGQPVEFVV